MAVNALSCHSEPPGQGGKGAKGAKGAQDALGAAPRRGRASRGALSEAKGRAAETLVAQHYEARGAALLHRRWRCAGGEIDLIFQEGDQIVMVEVKSSKSWGAALAQLGARQIQRLLTSASAFLGTQPRGQLTDMRIDVAAFDGRGQIEIIENALMA